LKTRETISAAEIERMMKLQDVILKAMAKKITWMAAEIAGISDRTMRRIKDRYEEFGYQRTRVSGLRPRAPAANRTAGSWSPSTIE